MSHGIFCRSEIIVVGVVCGLSRGQTAT